MINFKQYLEEKRGLWDNIHAKRKRIKNGSGEHMRKPGSKGAPSDADFKAANEEVELDEAVKLGSKVKIHAPGKDYHAQIGHIGEIRHGAHKDAPKTYTVDYGNSKSVQLDKKNFKLHKEENTIGYEGTDKLTKYRKKMTPGEKPVTPCMLPEFEDLEKNK